MGMPKNVDGKNGKELSGTIKLYDGLDLKKTSRFTYRARRRELQKRWTNDIKHLPGYFYFIITLDN
jgi:hypothetical protein